MRKYVSWHEFVMSFELSIDVLYVWSHVLPKFSFWTFGEIFLRKVFIICTFESMFSTSCFLSFGAAWIRGATKSKTLQITVDPIQWKCCKQVEGLMTWFRRSWFALHDVTNSDGQISTFLFTGSSCMKKGCNWLTATQICWMRETKSFSAIRRQIILIITS